jgi:hypothetical protein
MKWYLGRRSSNFGMRTSIGIYFLSAYHHLSAAVDESAPRHFDSRYFPPLFQYHFLVDVEVEVVAVVIFSLSRGICEYVDTSRPSCVRVGHVASDTIHKRSPNKTSTHESSKIARRHFVPPSDVRRRRPPIQLIQLHQQQFFNHSTIQSKEPRSKRPTPTSRRFYSLHILFRKGITTSAKVQGGETSYVCMLGLV